MLGDKNKGTPRDYDEDMEDKRRESAFRGQKGGKTGKKGKDIKNLEEDTGAISDMEE